MLTGVKVVPSSALFRRGAESCVYVIEDERARLRRVDTGNSDGFFTEVLEGLAVGEQVVRHPDNSLGNGVRVRSRL